MTRTLTVLVATAVATAVASTVAALATASPARAGIDPGAAACPSGHVCVDPVDGRQIRIAEGEARGFPGGVKATIENRTKVAYCVGGSPNFALAPDVAVAEIREIRAVAPMGGGCLT